MPASQKTLQLIVDDQKHLKDIGGRILVDRVCRTDRGCILWLCVNPDAEESTARNDGIISLGLAGRVKFHTAGLGPGEKLEQQKEQLQQV